MTLKVADGLANIVYPNLIDNFGSIIKSNVKSKFC